MNILFLSPVHPLLTPGSPLPFWQMQASWVRGLERAGAKVKVIRYTPGNRIRLSWGERLWRNIKVIREIKEIGEIDLIIFSLGADVLLPPTIKLIKWLTKAPLVVLSGVSPITDGNPRERAMAPIVDLAATNELKHAAEWLDLRAKRAVCLPISAMDPELHYDRGKKDQGDQKERRDIDILFVGSVTSERQKFFLQLRNLLPPNISLVVKEFVWEEEYARLISRAKIVLNPVRSEMKHGANLRMFEIPAFGALELASYGKKEWLTPGKEMLVYRDAQEAARLIVEYLKEGEKREEMIKRGKRRVIGEHKFEDRARRLIELVNGLMD